MPICWLLGWRHEQSYFWNEHCEELYHILCLHKVSHSGGGLACSIPQVPLSLRSQEHVQGTMEECTHKPCRQLALFPGSPWELRRVEMNEHSKRGLEMRLTKSVAG